jgi:hypothetical protein
MDAREPVFKLLHTAFKIDVEPFDILLRALAFVATPLVARHFLPRGWHFAKSDPSKRESTILTSPPPGTLLTALVALGQIQLTSRRD